MAKQSKKSKAVEVDDRWFDRSTCARFLGISIQHFERRYQSNISKADKIKRHRRWWFRGQAVVEAYAHAIAEQMPLATQHDVDEQPERKPTAADDKEKYQTELIKLKVLERKRELVPVGEVHNAVAGIARIIRKVGETLVKQYGNEAGRLIDQAVDRIANNAERWIGDVDADDISED